MFECFENIIYEDRRYFVQFLLLFSKYFYEMKPLYRRNNSDEKLQFA